MSQMTEQFARKLIADYYDEPSTCQGVTMWEIVQLAQGYVANIESQAELTRLRAEVEAYKADAERYRWLRRKVSAHGVIDGWTFAFPTYLALPASRHAMRNPAEDLDAQIDAARAALKEADK